MSQPEDGPMNGEPQENRWPVHVRVMAVASVLSYPLQWISGIVLGGAAVFLFGLGYPLDAWLVGLKVVSTAGLVGGGVYRWWFVRWGRRNYPDGKPV